MGKSTELYCWRNQLNCNVPSRPCTVVNRHISSSHMVASMPARLRCLKSLLSAKKSCRFTFCVLGVALVRDRLLGYLDWGTDPVCLC